MTNYTQHSEKPPTSKQQRLLRTLAIERGVSFTPPASCEQASAQIKSLLSMDRCHPGDRSRDVHAVRAGLASGAGQLAEIHDEEIGGFGSTAQWR